VTSSAADLAALQGAIAGDVVLPGSPAYEAVRRPPIARFHDIRPQAVVLCRTPMDVVETISFARRSGLGTATRSGGHCFAGRSSSRGIVIDVSPMHSVSVKDGVATVGAGARLGEVYDALEPDGVTIAAGCGPSVGIAGLALGGGLGILGRKHGLTCDQLVRAQVVLADGRVVECDEHQHDDLFWALRGAGGCQFGIVTLLVFRTVPAPPVTTLHLIWPDTHAATVIEAWQAWAPDAPDELAASLLVTVTGDVDELPSVHVFGAMLGTEGDAVELLGDLVVRAGADPSSTALRQHSFRAAKSHLAEHGPGEQPSPPGFGFSKSEFFRRPLPRDAIAALMEHLSDGRTPGVMRVLDFMPWGGAYNRIRPDATAFVHRAERFLLKHDVVVAADVASQERVAARSWLARSWGLVHPWGSGGVYPNFPDSDLEDWASAYHATNYDRLLRVKATYDPDNFFRFHQSLPARLLWRDEPRRPRKRGRNT
jgi:FAD/FMN-containing dehydrogenase